jgi:putative tricarboxylic transport membrane protein
LETLNSLMYGFSIALQPENLFFCFVGSVLGTLVGVLPGIGPVGAIAILLPITFKISTTGAIIMLAGLYYGAMYGGSTTSILVNIPGEAASVVTCMDGYQMALKGRAGAALGMSAFGSFIAGTLGIVGLMLFAVPLSKFALKFGPHEYFSLIILGLTFVTYLSHGSMMKSVMMCCFGLMLSNVGLDPITSSPRITFGIMELFDGIGIAPVAMGLFGVGEVLVNLERTITTEMVKTKVRNLFPSRLDWIASRWALVRGTLVGFFLGILPGGGPVLASFLSYGLEKRLSKHPEEFGKGAIEGVAGPESANNSAASSSFIPLLTLGIPPNVSLSILFGAFLIHGITPGPFLIKNNPDVFWGVLSSMYVGNVMLLVLNLPLIPMWVQVLKVPDKYLYPLILLFCLIGAYSMNNSIFDVFIMITFGLVGYLFRKFEYEGAPLVLAFVLGPLLDLNLRQALLISEGSFLDFFTRPISAVTLGLAVLLLVTSAVPAVVKRLQKYKESVSEDDMP